MSMYIANFTLFIALFIIFFKESTSKTPSKRNKKAKRNCDNTWRSSFYSTKP